ncbi:hypothetical protein O3G_MSEX011793 [Manduca sexta]|uniref:Uncharacterized protein n=1 Tax=Manduca sexta TaxID=7130 RepID=A0A921ZMW9_MANSE|nr:hypothetical protein O3G_MSEX011793 [Manduca sexta]
MNMLIKIVFTILIYLGLGYSVEMKHVLKRSVDSLIGSTNLGATATFGEQGVSDCIAAGNPQWKCYTEQSGINPQW